MNDIFENRVTIIIISIIWGFGFALLFHRVCQNNLCIMIKVPPIFNNGNQIIHNNNKCYRLIKYPSQCVY